MTRYAQHMRGRAKLAIIAIAALPTLAHAKQNFDVDIEKTGTAVVLEQTQPGYPGKGVRRGQEGWVRMSYVVTPDGRAIDPIILDSSFGWATLWNGWAKLEDRLAGWKLARQLAEI